MGKSLQVLVGCDPEIFVYRKGTAKNNIVTAHGLIPGNKWDPHKILDDMGMVQVDGCALEFGITPAKNQAEWFTRIKAVMAKLQEMVPEHKFNITPVAEFSQKYWDKEIPEEAKAIGCEPDWNAWTGDINPPPDTTAFPNMRTAAGHIHVGWCTGKDPMDKSHLLDCQLVVKQLDYYIGIFSLLWDGDSRRRSLYGKAGAFRPKPYGCEYRVPSNMWLAYDPLIDWIYYAARLAVRDLAKGNDLVKKYGDEAQKIINESDVTWYNNLRVSAKYMPHANIKAYMRKEPGMRGPNYNEG